MGYPQGVADILPLSSAQRGMLFHVEGQAQLRGQYVAVISCTLTGRLDAQRLKHAMAALVNAHDALRAGFIWKGVKQPVQVIQEEVSLPWTELDWTKRPDAERGLEDLLKLEQLRKFDLKKPPLMAVTLIKLAKDRWHFVWTMHHLISDGWSTGVAFRDLFHRYNGHPQDGASPSFKTYLTWLKKQGPLTDKDFWTGYLSDLDAPSVLPELDNHSDASIQLSHSELLGQDLMDRIERAATSLKVTPNTVLSGAWALVLRRYLQQDDVVFGTTTAGRPPEISNISQAVGAYISTLPVRFKIDPDKPVDVFLQDHAMAEVERLKHEYASLAEVQTCAPFPKGTPVFDTVFVNEGVQQTGYDFGEIQVAGLKTVQFSNYPLSLLVTPQNDLGVEVYFDPARITIEAVRSCISSYKQVLTAIAAAPDTQISDVMKGHAQKISVSAAPPAETVVERFLQQADTMPDATALTDSDQTLSYAETSLRARQIAFALRRSGVRETDIIPVALPRGADAIAGFLGVMMAGASYVPLDLDYPEHRIAQILQATQPRFVVTTQDAFSTLPETTAAPVFLDTLEQPMDPSEVATGTRAYVMFTSGSENRPKGVEISHEGLAISTSARDQVYGSTPEVYLLLSSLAFDSSVAGVYWTLCTGGHLVIAEKQAEQRPAALGQLIAQHGVTHTLCLPSLAGALLASVPPQDLQSLKVLIAAGEALYPSLPRDLRHVVPHCRLMNEYGPTEGTVWCTGFDATGFDGGSVVPIGTAIPGTWVGIFDSDDCPAAPGIVGEIIVAGHTVANGYLNDEAQTKDRFFQVGPVRAYRTGDLGVADDAGCITFLGRKDKQVKIRGHRVELTEIEAAAQVVTANRRVTALAIDRAGSNTIILAIECPPNDTMCEAAARHIQASLPDPFHPSAVLGIDEFPTLPNGKLDQNALRTLIADQTLSQTGAAPKDGLETQIATIFAETLSTECQTRDANFFDLGGNSLATITAYTKGQEQGVHFEPIDLFSCPTVAELAKRVADRRAGAAFSKTESTVQISNPGPGKTTVVIAHCSVKFSKYMARSLGDDHSVVHIPSHRTEGTPVPFDKSFEELADEAISRLKQTGNTRPFVLCGYSAGCPMVMEMARQLGDEAVLGMILLDPPFKMVGAEPALQPLYFRSYKRLRYVIKGWKRHYRARRTLPDIKRILAEQADAEETRIRGVEIVHELAVSDFRVPRFDRPAHVFLSRGNPSLTPGDVLDTHLRDKRCHSLDMEHVELMNRPDVFSTIASVIADVSNP
ncbi:non-ribosomal peptide synthetase [Ruegeria sp. R14_0]|uniref:non-ribosomal peptide synthetase n=1 Tax=Ruegeria sp. R14_0 TaxID=2821100 RepID=UPI001ADBEE88|nr:non-ribosomal peptide synthetase [Ruegeria sp. R14_0]MBO9446353.1 amino acid adenylation domain-containing protein [Ruegeria sp. R14_0]